MKNKQFNRYYLLSCIGVLIASYYPLYMGVRVISDMIIDGTVLKENYPKYIIPYTPHKHCYYNWHSFNAFVHKAIKAICPCGRFFCRNGSVLCI